VCSEKEEIELQLRAVPDIERRIEELEAVMAERRS
jgi:ATP-binding cassette subfamily D (ALD) long-chain fatty acid import protein